MRKSITTAALAALGLLAACTEPRSSGTNDDLDAEFAREVETLPSQDEADRQAASRITADNADAELESLLQEIDEDTTDG